SWNCDLEAKAQEWANGCVREHSKVEWRKAGENLYQYYSTKQVQASKDWMNKAAEHWWAELAEHGLIGSNYKFDSNSVPINHWTAV
ncbi:unnamed protein product, partial [Anisakis simplex]|uniref:SCP domain-containing protein n=1 Tax=Anisakis simplex TaxID=6269 RepID=A0A0M3JIS7_ANISI